MIIGFCSILRLVSAFVRKIFPVFMILKYLFQKVFSIVGTQRFCRDSFVSVRMKITITSSFLDDRNIVPVQKKRLEFIKTSGQLRTIINRIPQKLFLCLEYGGSRFKSGSADFLIHFIQFILPMHLCPVFFFSYFCGSRRKKVNLM